MAIDLAVVPVAGIGTRLLPSTKSQPKEMLPVGRKPVVQYVVEELAQSGIHRILFITGNGKQSIEDFFDWNRELIAYLRQTGREDQLEALQFEREPIEFAYTRQREQLGLGHAVLCAQPFVADQPFVVALGDSIIGLHAQSNIVQRMVDQYEQEKADVVIAFEEIVDRRDVVHYGIAKPRGEAGDVFELEDLVEKPSVEEAPSTLAVAARYVFGASIFEKLAETEPGKGGEIQLTDAIRSVLQAGGKGIGIRLDAGERRFDIGNFDSYFRTFVEFALADPHHGSRLREHIAKLLDQ
ncbi:MAG: UTP--glucose-1-phosphate uridylyltransferase [Pirellulales bacterium]|jgi:UTP--glucose-1-phosphate uridylyltransferase